MGLIKPKNYFSSSLSDSEKDFIITHEMCHIKGLDSITRILGFVALFLHWFNPLVWVAFIVSGKDMELSCDEAVMKKTNTDIRAEYSQSLLRFATGKKMLYATPLAFGEGDTTGAKLAFDMDIKTGKLLKKSTPYNSKNVRLEISDETIGNIGKKLYERILKLSSA